MKVYFADLKTLFSVVYKGYKIEGLANAKDDIDKIEKMNPKCTNWQY